MRETKSMGRQVSAERLALCAWTVLLTNVPADLLSVEEALALRRLRWQNVMLSPGPAKAGTPNSVRPAPKITTECYEASNMTVPLMM